MSEKAVTSIGILSDQKIGEKTGFVKIPYKRGNNTVFDYLITGYNHIHGTPWTYPKLANSILLTSANGIWNNTGSIIEIIPKNTLIKVFDIHWINIYNISANAEGLIQIYAGDLGSEIEISSTKLNRSAIMAQEGPKRIQIPQQQIGTRISCRLSDSTAGQITCNVSFEGHYYG